MATTAQSTTTTGLPRALRTGSALMALASLGFVGYAVIFFVRNFSGAFLELGIGPAQVDVGRDEIRAFSNDLYHYVSHLHIAVSGFIAATGLATASLAWFGARRGELWAYVTAVPHPWWASLSLCLPTTRGPGHNRPPRPHLPGHRSLRRRCRTGPEAVAVIAVGNQSTVATVKARARLGRDRLVDRGNAVDSTRRSAAGPGAGIGHAAGADKY
jgi:hypothetical protein